jgi:hypothetical protein
MRFRRTVSGLACALLLLVGGCDPLDVPDGPAQPGTSVDAAQAGQELDALTVAGWASMSGYSRDRFKHWIGQGGGCDTRDVVLKRDASSIQVGADCKITGGSWVSAYDGKPESDPQDMDIDHMVPLANAWRTGAKDWTDDQRSAFANDLARPQLLAVSLSSNRSKGDQDPSQWKPPDHGYWCTYAQRWIVVKAYWKLSVTTDEKAALHQMLGSCA